jgi:hypothetical protein
MSITHTALFMSLYKAKVLSKHSKRKIGERDRFMHLFRSACIRQVSHSLLLEVREYDIQTALATNRWSN